VVIIQDINQWQRANGKWQRQHREARAKNARQAQHQIKNDW
jgi:hypothetical protein